MVRHGTKGARVGLAHVALFLLSAASLALASTTQHVSQNKHFGHARQAKELPKQNPSHAYVAACVLAKNEHLYIREFIQYHHWIGIDKFYVWDHQSSPPMADVLEDYVLSSLVEVFYFSDSWKADDAHHRSLYNTSTRAFLSPQGWAYDNCFRMFSYRHTFMVLIDPDEYIILKQQPLQQQTAAASATAGADAIAAVPNFGPAPDPPSLPAFLAAFEPYGGILVHWQLFGPSGHMRRPRGSTLEQYTQCQPKPALQNWRQFNSIPLGFVKSITATRCYQRGCNPHVCELKPGCRYVNEKFLELSSSVVKAVHWDRIAVFHYVTRSAEDYKAKMGRGTGHSQFLAANKAAGRTHRGWRYFLTVNASATATCGAAAVDDGLQVGTRTILE
eukprot:XP_001700421.1 predicted protein [Chlamydomonas reinhardtii]